MQDIISRFATPPGGWHFMNGFRKIEAMDYNSLVRHVTDHFRNNHIEIGNVEEAIQNQIAERWPQGKIRR